MGQRLFYLLTGGRVDDSWQRMRQPLYYLLARVRRQPRIRLVKNSLLLILVLLPLLVAPGMWLSMRPVPVEWRKIPTTGFAPVLPESSLVFLSNEHNQQLLVGTGSGLYRSEDGGTSWRRVEALSDLSIHTLVSDASGQHLFAGTNQRLYRSDDRGASWRPIGELPSRWVEALVSDASGQRLVARATGQLYRSEDGGTSWQLVEELSTHSVHTLASDASGQHLVVATPNGVYRSDDGGTSWRPVNQALSDLSVETMVSDASGQHLFVETNRGAYRSDDGGTSWRPVNQELAQLSVQAFVNDASGQHLVATALGSAYRSDNGGAAWQRIHELSNFYVQTLVSNASGQHLFAGTDQGLYRSDDGGIVWQSVEDLSKLYVQTLASDASGQHLFAGTNGQLYRSDDGGTSWLPVNQALSDLSIHTLVSDLSGEHIVAGTNEGLYRSDDRGASWRAVKELNQSVETLVSDGSGQRLVARSNNKLYRSEDGGTSWQEVKELSLQSVQTLASDASGQHLVVATPDGVYRSDNGGTSWRPVNQALSDQSVETLASDASGQRLVARSNSQLYRSEDGGTSWRRINRGFNDQSIRRLVSDSSGQHLVVATFVGVYRSEDSGTSWRRVEALGTQVVQTLVSDASGQHLFAGTNQGLYRSDDSGANWFIVNSLPTDGKIADLALMNGKDGVWLRARMDEGRYFYSNDGGQRWRTNAGGNLDIPRAPQFFLTSENNRIGLHDRDSGWTQLISGALPEAKTVFVDESQGIATIYSMSSAAQVQRGDVKLSLLQLPRPYQWLVGLGQRALTVVMENWRWSLMSLVVASALVLAGGVVLNYVRLARPLGIPVWATILARRRLDSYAQPERLERAWPAWDTAVRSQLLQFGDVFPADLWSVPEPFRHYTFRRYVERHPEQSLEESGGALRLLSGDQLQRCQEAWQIASSAVGSQPGIATRGLKAIDTLASILAERLGLTLGKPRDFGATRAYLADAPALRLNIPRSFTLIFVADPDPGDHTVQLLVDATDVIKEEGFFALIVPLQPLDRRVDAVERLHIAINRSPYAQDFVVLSQDDVLDILIARQPVQKLARIILKQVDLTIASPFVINGPVPQSMFFGREAEMRLLVEHAGRADFAIIGNRKIGKTSLLQRTRAKLDVSDRVRTLYVDCQTLHTAAAFLDGFQDQTGITLPSATPDSFAKAMANLRHAGGPLVLLMDEVDALLKDEQQHGELLVSKWRELAQADVCHFIFCGSTRLASRLDDPHSVFFNFPQPQSLSYLDMQTVRLMLTQPFDTLGVVLEQEDVLLDEVYALTSGHPNLVQYVGRSLVEAANERQERRVLLDDVALLRNTSAFIDHYLKTVWGEAGPLEKLMTLVAPAGAFRLAELETALASEGVQVSDDELEASLKMLQVYAILTKHERSYRFVPGAFHDILHRTQEVERLIRREKRALAGVAR